MYPPFENIGTKKLIGEAEHGRPMSRQMNPAFWPYHRQYGSFVELGSRYPCFSCPERFIARIGLVGISAKAICQHSRANWIPDAQAQHLQPMCLLICLQGLPERRG